MKTRGRVGDFLGEFWLVLTRQTPAFCGCPSCVEIPQLRADLAHVRDEAATAHASFCRACHSYWRLFASEAASRAETARLTELVAMLNRLAVEAAADPTRTNALAEVVVRLTDTDGTAKR